VKARAPEGMADRIASLGGELVAVENHLDLYFNSPLRDFRRSDEALRIRIKEEGARLTYKGPKLDSATKSRMELTVRIRSKYSYQGLTLALDEVEGLGSFLEVEAQAEEDIEEPRLRVLKVLGELGLDESIRSSYLELLEEKRQLNACVKREQI
ncbi:MAG: class IV adenylate cyclase, partial [Methanothrix sp.]|nr:class IV adenylate cyclase [Methanothrix sp.]